MAAQTKQASLLDPKNECSVFTYFLEKGVRGGADANRDKIITVTEVFTFFEEEVKKHSYVEYGKQNCF